MANKTTNIEPSGLVNIQAASSPQDVDRMKAIKNAAEKARRDLDKSGILDRPAIVPLFQRGEGKASCSTKDATDDSAQFRQTVHVSLDKTRTRQAAEAGKKGADALVWIAVIPSLYDADPSAALREALSAVAQVNVRMGKGMKQEQWAEVLAGKRTIEIKNVPSKTYTKAHNAVGLDVVLDWPGVTRGGIVECKLSSAGAKRYATDLVKVREHSYHSTKAEQRTKAVESATNYNVGLKLDKAQDDMLRALVGVELDTSKTKFAEAIVELLTELAGAGVEFPALKQVG